MVLCRTVNKFSRPLSNESTGNGRTTPGAGDADGDDKSVVSSEFDTLSEPTAVVEVVAWVLVVDSEISSSPEWVSWVMPTPFEADADVCGEVAPRGPWGEVEARAVGSVDAKVSESPFLASFASCGAFEVEAEEEEGAMASGD